MTLQEILDMVDLLVPNTVPLEMKVRKINQLQRQYFRDHPLPDAVARLQTAPDVAFYDLPPDCPEDRIRSVVVNGVQVPYATLNEPAPAAFWTMVAGQMMLYPTPTTVMDVFIYYEPSYQELTPSNLSTVPQFPEDYHEALAYGCAAWVAKVNRDVPLANNLQADAIELFAKADRDFQAAKPLEIVDALSGWWY